MLPKVLFHQIAAGIGQVRDVAAADRSKTLAIVNTSTSRFRARSSVRKASLKHGSEYRHV
jgi:hypothetical protein